MTPASYTSVGVGTTALAQALLYFSHWPLQPLTEGQATAFAGLIIAAIGLIHAAINARPVKEPPPAPTP